MLERSHRTDDDGDGPGDSVSPKDMQEAPAVPKSSRRLFQTAPTLVPPPAPGTRLRRGRKDTHQGGSSNQQEYV